jgi:Ni/Co efflux regulator RcnB
MKLHVVFVSAFALLLASQGALADPKDGHGHGHDKDRSGDGRYGDDDDDGGRHDNGKHKGWDKHAYKRGERLPDYYYTREYYVQDYDHYHLRRPDPGYRWVRGDGGQFFLTIASSGVIIDIAAGL